MKPLHTQLKFPANLYAHALMLEEGQVGALHCATFQHPDDSVQQAQAAAYRSLSQQLPPPPACILCVGLSLGGLEQFLQKAGYIVHAIDEDPFRIELVERLLDISGQLHCGSLDDFKAHDESYDALIMQQEALEPSRWPALWLRLRGLLKVQGRLLWLGRCQTERDASTEHGLPLCEHVSAQLKRVGMAEIFSADWSESDATLAARLLAALETHQQQLLADLPIIPSQWESAHSEVRQHILDKRHYGLRVWEKTAQPLRWQVRAMQPSDQVEIRQLFEQVFEHPLSAEMWQWKYDEGRGRATLAWRDGELVAHYGGMLRSVQYFGELHRSVQIGDVMVAQQERGIFTRRGVFYHTAATFPELWVGYGMTALIGYGFPTAQAMRVAEKQGLYAEVGHMLQLHWPAKQHRALLNSKLRPLAQDQNAPAIVNRLWAQMGKDLREYIVNVRDWAFVQQRYLQHPHKSYEFLLVMRRFSDLPLGLIIVEKRADHLFLIDYIGPSKNLQLCLLQLQRQAQSWGFPCIYGWISNGCADFFRNPDSSEQVLDLRIPTSIHSPGPAAETVRDRWWLMAGDTDFH